jgi:hypothetical protein
MDSFDESVRQVRMKSEAPVRVLAVATMDDGSVWAFDQKQSVGLRLAAGHPFRLELESKAARIIEGLPALLKSFGTWDTDRFALVSSDSQWQRWAMTGGSLESEIVVRGDIDIALHIGCVPVDERAAHAMFMAYLLRELDSREGPMPPEVVQRAAKSLRSSRDFFSEVDIPSEEDVQAAAWDSQRWSLSYRLAATEDGL